MVDIATLPNSTTISRTNKHGTITMTTIMDTLPLRGIFEEIRQDYIKIARTEINEVFGTDWSKITVRVDGNTERPIENATLGGSGIDAFEDVTVYADEMMAAFQAAWNYLTGFRFTKSGRSTGRYASGLTVLVNGIEQMPVREKIGAKTVIQIFTTARHASPIESIYAGNVMLAARNRAKAATGGKEIGVSFTYRKARGNITQEPSKWNPLAIPVIEIGGIAAGTTDEVGNVSENLRRVPRRKKPNLVKRRILGEEREFSGPAPRRRRR
jgi:hypothetical protein